MCGRTRRCGSLRTRPEAACAFFFLFSAFTLTDLTLVLFFSISVSEPYVHKIAIYWSKFHRASSKVPQFALLAFSGFIGNFVLSWVRCLFSIYSADADYYLSQFHKSEKKAAAGEAAAAVQAGGEKKKCVSIPSSRLAFLELTLPSPSSSGRLLPLPSSLSNQRRPRQRKRATEQRRGNDGKGVSGRDSHRSLFSNPPVILSPCLTRKERKKSDLWTWFVSLGQVGLHADPFFALRNSRLFRLSAVHDLIL
jgi:hypothetical protein